MSQAEFVRFLRAARDSPAMLDRYAPMDMSRMMFHARGDGFRFTIAEAGQVIGRLEVDVVVGKDGEPFDGSSGLWRQMWARRYLDYLVHDVVSRFTDEELS
ncbi:hypothetical protein [Nonomuraea sp. NPDC003804]|uniref:hypothetical protein n=1 Tax=Nonomuraea sp. NPDC003804 TaxID=3154547 RepID=UPI0033A9E12E